MTEPPSSTREPGRTSPLPPGPEVTPVSFEVEHPGPVHDIFFSIAQRGYMPLKVEVVSTAPWMEVRDLNDQGQRKGVTVRITLDALPVETPQAGSVEVRWSQGCTRVEVRATRYDIGRAIERYLSGRQELAKDICRRLIDNVPQQRSASFLLASLYLDDHNFPAAVRILQDLSASSSQAPPDPLLQQLPEAAVSDMLTVLGEHFSILKPLEYGIHVLTELLEGSQTELAPHIRPLLRRAYLQYLQDLTEERRSRPRDPHGESSDLRRTLISMRSPQRTALQDVLPSQQRLDGLRREEILRLLGYARKATQLFPDERTWQEVVRSLEDNLKERSTRALLGTARIVGMVTCVLLLCSGGYTLLQQRGLDRAQAELRLGRYESALQAAEGVLPGLGRSRRAHALAGEILLSWADQARRAGEFAVAWGRLEAAGQHPGVEARLPGARATLLEAWSDELLHRGRFDLALERLDEALKLAPQNKRLQVRRQSITSVAALYRQLRRLTLATAASPHPERAQSTPADPPAGAYGIDLLAPQTQVLITDWDGEAPDEVVVSGHEPGAAPDATRIAVHRPRVRELPGGAIQVRLETVFSRPTGRRNRPAALQAYAAGPLGLQVRGKQPTPTRTQPARAAGPAPAGEVGGLRILQADLPRATEGSGTSLLIWRDGDKLCSWSPPRSVAPSKGAQRLSIGSSRDLDVGADGGGWRSAPRLAARPLPLGKTMCSPPAPSSTRITTLTRLSPTSRGCRAR